MHAGHGESVLDRLGARSGGTVYGAARHNTRTQMPVGSSSVLEQSSVRSHRPTYGGGAIRCSNCRGNHPFERCYANSRGPLYDIRKDSRKRTRSQDNDHYDTSRREDDTRKRQRAGIQSSINPAVDAAIEKVQTSIIEKKSSPVSLPKKNKKDVDEKLLDLELEEYKRQQQSEAENTSGQGQRTSSVLSRLGRKLPPEQRSPILSSGSSNGIDHVYARIDDDNTGNDDDEWEDVEDDALSFHGITTNDVKEKLSQHQKPIRSSNASASRMKPVNRPLQQISRKTTANPSISKQSSPPLAIGIHALQPNRTATALQVPPSAPAQLQPTISGVPPISDKVDNLGTRTLQQESPGAMDNNTMASSITEPTKISNSCHLAGPETSLTYESSVFSAIDNHALPDASTPAKQAPATDERPDVGIQQPIDTDSDATNGVDEIGFTLISIIESTRYTKIQDLPDLYHSRTNKHLVTTDSEASAAESGMEHARSIIEEFLIDSGEYVIYPLARWAFDDQENKWKSVDVFDKFVISIAAAAAPVVPSLGLHDIVACSTGVNVGQLAFMIGIARGDVRGDMSSRILRVIDEVVLSHGGCCRIDGSTVLVDCGCDATVVAAETAVVECVDLTTPVKERKSTRFNPSIEIAAPLTINAVNKDPEAHNAHSNLVADVLTAPVEVSEPICDSEEMSEVISPLVEWSTEVAGFDDQASKTLRGVGISQEGEIESGFAALLQILTTPYGLPPPGGDSSDAPKDVATTTHLSAPANPLDSLLTPPRTRSPSGDTSSCTAASMDDPTSKNKSHHELVNATELSEQDEGNDVVRQLARRPSPASSISISSPQISPIDSFFDHPAIDRESDGKFLGSVRDDALSNNDTGGSSMKVIKIKDASPPPQVTSYLGYFPDRIWSSYDDDES